jgi:FlgD Ig-like domain
MSKFAILTLGLLLVVSFVSPAQANYVSGLAVEIDQPEKSAVAGELYTGRLLILGENGQQLTDLSIEGSRWQGLSWTRADYTQLEPDVPLAIEFSGIPLEASARLQITVRAGNQVLHRTFTLGGSEYERRVSALPLKPADFPVPEPQLKSHVVELSVQPKFLPAVDGAATERSGRGRNIRIHGRFIYVRADTTILGADGLTIHAWDDDPFVNDHLGTSGTDAYGNFDFTVYWDPQPGEDNPDLLVEFLTENNEVIVKGFGTASPFKFVHGPLENYSGSDLDIGVMIPAFEEDNPIPHLLSNYTRFWRYIASNGHETRYLEVKWPEDEDDGTRYNRVSETIYVTESAAWESGTHAHEYGHFVMDCLSELPTIEYCNDICDPDPPTDCTHCIWCEENEAVAWSEGFANYTGTVIPLTFEEDYDFQCLNPMFMNSVRICHEDSIWADALITEGYTATALVDFSNPVTMDDDPQFPGFQDRIDLGERVILDLLATDSYTSSMDYMFDLMALFPAQREEFWRTAMNSGFNLDEQPPDPVYPVLSPSHEMGVPTANPNLRLLWNKPADDASGVRGYALHLTGVGHPVDPGIVVTQVDDTTRDYFDLVPGTYYFSIRSVDWDGNPADDFTSWGPYIITEPQPRNLAFNQPAGWWFYVLPRNTDDVTMYNCPEPVTLDSTLPTFWNLSGINDGDLSTVEDLVTSLRVDGVERDRHSWGDMPGWGTYSVMNEGPLLVLGGLHTFTGCLDPDEAISETNESDNEIGKQFAWRPPVIEPSHVYSNSYDVPDPTGDWDTVIDMVKFYNCYGMTFNSSGWWNAFVMWADNPETDYDLRLHEVTESPLGGFRIYQAASNQPAGWADAVVVNRNLSGDIPWDAAIVNHQNDSGSLRYTHITCQTIAYGDSVSTIMGEDEYLLLRELEVEHLDTGGISLDLWTDPPQANVSFSWCDTDFTTGDIMAADAIALTGADGQAHLEVSALTAGYTCLMVCRQPMDGDDDLQVTIRIRPTLPDLEPAFLSDWFAPIVPRADTEATVDLVALPGELHGDVTDTWFNYAVGNISTGTAIGTMFFYVQVDTDEGGFRYNHLFDIPGGETRGIINDGPRMIRGGRHAIVLNLDATNHMQELNEENNTYGRQYVWSGLVLNSGDSVTREAPPERLGGWPNISAGFPIYYNCDGLRSAYTGTYWRAIAVMPGENSDVDIRLHEAESDVLDGFGVKLRYSGWGPGQSDYLLVNFNLTTRRPFDVGVLNMGGSEDYSTEVLHEQWLGTGALDYGPVIMPADQILDLYEIQLTPGDWRITLENVAGMVDWGLTLHPGDMEYMSKTDALADGAAWLAEPGMDEEITVTIEDEAYCAITVWKVGASDLSAEGTYTLHVAADEFSLVQEETLPAVTRMGEIYPNPFNPQTTIHYELARTTQVDLAVFDVKGRRIATLVRSALPAGRYRQVWNGLDSSGHPAASGVYMIRLSGDGTTDLKKMTLLK